MKTVHIVVSGRVQGVGYRRFVERTALKLGFKGWVRNLNDGRVEAMVQSSQGEIESLTSALRLGPAMAEVTDLQAQSISHNESFASFEIQRDGEQLWAEN